MQDRSFGSFALNPHSLVLLRHVFDVACDQLRDRVTDANRARMREVVGSAIVDLARKGQVNPDRLLEHALERARHALN